MFILRTSDALTVPMVWSAFSGPFFFAAPDFDDTLCDNTLTFAAVSLKRIFDVLAIFLVGFAPLNSALVPLSSTNSHMLRSAWSLAASRTGDIPG